MAQKKNSSKRNKGLAFAIFLLVALVIFILFLVKRDTIVTNLQETQFFDKVFGEGSTPEFVQNHVPEKTDDKIDLNDEVVIIEVGEKTLKQETSVKTETPKTDNKVENKTETKVPETPVQTTKPVEEKKPEPVKTETPKSYTTLQLCFVQIDADGSVNRKIVKRTVEKNDSPLTTALKLLLEGPDNSLADEKNCMSLIPNGTKLISAKVQNGVAYLNFNDSFEINTVGVEGYIGQLMQIVYTATTFSTVNSVQFLIEGERKDYLGYEGQWIGSPLSRSSFK